MGMSLNVNYTALYKNGIDPSVLKDVSSEILNRAAAKNSQYNNTSQSITGQVSAGARPIELGIDLYNGRVNSTIQRQIATNSVFQYQFNEQTVQAMQYLNSQAAFTKRVEGKFTPAVNEIVTETQKSTETNPNRFQSIFTSETSKDKNGSNPFYHGELLMSGKDKESHSQENTHNFIA